MCLFKLLVKIVRCRCLYKLLQLVTYVVSKRCIIRKQHTVSSLKSCLVHLVYPHQNDAVLLVSAQTCNDVLDGQSLVHSPVTPVNLR